MWPCERLDVIDSTQRELQRRLSMIADAADQPPGPFAVWTTRQTSGMASHGRQWRDASHGLAFSVAWPESMHRGETAAWPVRLSLAVASTLESLYPSLAHRLGVKWPNDIMCGEEKLAGVLISRHAVATKRWLIAGVGINLRWDIDAQLDRPVTSLAKLGIAHVDEQLLVSGLRASISKLWADRQNDISWRLEYEQRDVHFRKRVLVVHPITGELLHEGIAEGISQDGELMLRIGQKLCAIQIGEVSVRAHQNGQHHQHADMQESN